MGGSTRTPLVSDLLLERTGLEPRQDVHPDLCVALGAGVLASRLAGHARRTRPGRRISLFVRRLLPRRTRRLCPIRTVTSPIIRRNTPLPLTRTERYFTSHPYQTEVDIQVYQGDDEDALKNILVGDFRIEGLTPIEEPNEILCRMRLDLDGILEVTAVEKRTGKSKHITIANALHAKSAEEIAAGRRRIQELFEGRVAAPEEEGAEAAAVGNSPAVNVISMGSAPHPSNGEDEAKHLMERSRRLLEKMHAEDREEAIDLHEKIEAAIESRDSVALRETSQALKELLFFVEGN